MRLIALSAAVTVAALTAGHLPGFAQAADSTPRLTWAPTRVSEGSIIEITLRMALSGDSSTGIVGETAGEPLHFTSSGTGRFTAIAAIPVGAPDTLEVRVIVARPMRSDTLRVPMPVARGSYRVEKLSVAPRFGREPDSALAARIASEGARAVAISRRSHDGPRLWNAPWRLPRDARVTSPFGGAREFNGVVQSRHMGVDLAGATGATVRAANRGVVALVDTFYLAGKVVYLDHGAGLVTGYFHLANTLVQPGDTIQRGQMLGRVGATGRVTGPHLHWIARYGTVTVDPRTLLRLKARCSARGDGCAGQRTSPPATRSSSRSPRLALSVPQ